VRANYCFFRVLLQVLDDLLEDIHFSTGKLLGLQDVFEFPSAQLALLNQLFFFVNQKDATATLLKKIINQLDFRHLVLI
jgi:hypothetical protein